MIRVIAFILLSAVVSGCATTPARPPVHIFRWSKLGATYDEFLKDRYACLTESRTQASSGFAYQGIASTHSGEVFNTAVFLACLAARGYRQDPGGFGPPEGGGVPLYRR